MSGVNEQMSIQSILKNTLNGFENTVTDHNRNELKLRKACQDFESIFIKQLFSSMRNASDMKAGLFGNGFGGELFQDLFDTEIARSAASGGGYGLSERLFRQLSAHLQAAGAVTEDAVTARKEPFVSASQVPEPLGRFEREVDRAAKKHNLDTALIYAVIQRESGGRTDAVSPKGAKGLMQLMDGTARELGVTRVFNPEQNIEGGARYLRRMLDRYGGNMKLALAAYNAGPGNVDRYGGIPPFTETQNYVEKVMETYDSFMQTKDDAKVRNV